MGSLRQFSILIWKNYKLVLRHPWVSLLTLLIPVILMTSLIFARRFYEIEQREIETTFESYSIRTLPDTFTKYGNSALYYSPKSQFLDGVMNRASALMNISVVGFDSETELEESYIKSTIKVVAGVLFDNTVKNGIQAGNISITNGTQSGKINITIRPEMIPENKWNLSYFFTMIPSERLSDKSLQGTYYWKMGFLAVQHAVLKALTEAVLPNWGEKFDDKFDIRMHRQPYPPYQYDSFYEFKDYFFGILICLGYLLPSAFLVKLIVRERTSKLKKSLLVLGFSNWQIWLAWFLSAYIILFIISFIIAMLLCVRLKELSILNASHFGIILFWLLVYSLVVIAFSFAVSVFFKNEDSAISAFSILYVLTFLPYIHSRNLWHYLPYYGKMLLCLLHNTLFGYSVRIVLRLEQTGFGLRWRTVNYTRQIKVPFSMKEVFLMLLFDCFLYLVITWYAEVMFSDQSGRTYPWYFPLTVSYWTKKDSEADSASQSRKAQHVDPSLFEKYLTKVKPMVSLENVSKTYDCTKPVVKEASLSAYKHQITVLLGHEKSGKTTISNLITGAIMPSEGSIKIKALDMSRPSNRRQLAPLIGYCPEYDIFIPELTVQENLYFFCKAKDFADGVDAQIDKSLEILDLEHRRHFLASSLTSNRKRQLTIAISLVGDSEVVVIDEPTKHLNPSFRSKVWSALSLKKQGRAIIVTTSFMREADQIADRIFFVKDGSIKCSGSPAFLKRSFGAGYEMTIKHSRNNIGYKNVVSAKLPNSHVISEAENEITFNLPHDDMHLYPDLLKHLEEDENVCDILINETPLSVLYDRLFDDQCLINQNEVSQTVNLSPETSSSSDSLYVKERNEGCSLFLQHMKALLVKRYRFSSRKYFLTAVQIVFLPLIFLCSFFVSNNAFVAESEEILNLYTVKQLLGTNIIYGIDPSSNETIDIGDTYAHLFTESEFLYMVDLEEENYGRFLLNIAINDPLHFKRQYIIGATFEKDFNNTRLFAYYDTEAYHSAAISLLFLHNAVLAYLAKTKDFAFVVFNKPLPYKNEDFHILSVRVDLDLSFYWAQDFLTGMAVLMSTFTVILVLEKNRLSKFQQILNGINAFVYWLSSFLFDFVIYACSCGILLIVLNLLHSECFSGWYPTGVLAILLTLHGISALLFIYCCTFFLYSSATAIMKIFLYYFFGLLCLGIVFMVEDLKFYDAFVYIDFIFAILMPSYCFGRGVYNIFRNCVNSFVCDSPKVSKMCQYGNITEDIVASCCLDSCEDRCSFWSHSHFSLYHTSVTYQLIFLAVQPFVFVLFLILLEIEMCKKDAQKKKKIIMPAIQTEMVDEVEAEAKRITDSSVKDLAHTHSLIVREAFKYITYEFTVGKFTFGLKNNECFGLLGFEQSGKTTAFGMISGSIPLTSGNIYIFGYSPTEDPLKVQDKIGVSFGHGALLNELTVLETLKLYAQIKGIQQKKIKSFLKSLISSLDLDADILVEHLHHIDRHKLSVAIAILGTPPLILLDEPTADMDPASSKITRQAINTAISYGCTVFFTTNRLKDSLALCDRVGILVHGKLSYVGNLGKLETQYEDGITIILKLQKTKVAKTRHTRQQLFFEGGPREDVKTEIEHFLPAAVLKISLPYYLDYFVPKKKTKWSELFEFMEGLKKKGLVESYSISQTKLENCYAYLASVQEKEVMKISQFLKERKRSKF